jgi:hypothetical protein
MFRTRQQAAFGRLFILIETPMNCSFCGHQLPVRNGIGRPNKYCGERCRREAAKSNLKTYACRVCGREFRSPWRAWYCSDECKTLRPCKVRRTRRACGICGTSFEPRNSKQACCSLDCAHLASGNSQRKRYAVCLYCGKTWKPRQTIGRSNRPRVFCSYEHFVLHVRENGLAAHRSLVRQVQESLGVLDLSQGDTTRRVVSPDLRAKVLQRDSLICQECGRELHDVRNRIDPFKATIDHIVPRCLGGTDRPENLRVLCHECNSSQGRIYGGLAHRQQPAVA